MYGSPTETSLLLYSTPTVYMRTYTSSISSQSHHLHKSRFLLHGFHSVDILVHFFGSFRVIRCVYIHFILIILWPASSIYICRLIHSIGFLSHSVRSSITRTMFHCVSSSFCTVLLGKAHVSVKSVNIEVTHYSNTCCFMSVVNFVFPFPSVCYL